MKGTMDSSNGAIDKSISLLDEDDRYERDDGNESSFCLIFRYS